MRSARSSSRSAATRARARCSTAWGTLDRGRGDLLHALTADEPMSLGTAPRGRAGTRSGRPRRRAARVHRHRGSDSGEEILVGLERDRPLDHRAVHVERLDRLTVARECHLPDAGHLREREGDLGEREPSPVALDLGDVGSRSTYATPWSRCQSLIELGVLCRAGPVRFRPRSRVASGSLSRSSTPNASGTSRSTRTMRSPLTK